MKKTIQFTKEGFEEVKQEHAKLTQDRKAAVEKLAWARDLGDRSENGAYKAARWKLSQIDSRIRHLNRLLDYGEVVENTTPETIGLGTKVKIQSADRTMEVTLVGGYETDIAKGKLSTYSPIGKALLGKKEGDSIEVHTPRGKAMYSILRVM